MAGNHVRTLGAILSFILAVAKMHLYGLISCSVAWDGDGRI